jgi:hypothetical protein
MSKDEQTGVFMKPYSRRTVLVTGTSSLLEGALLDALAVVPHLG